MTVTPRMREALFAACLAAALPLAAGMPVGLVAPAAAQTADVTIENVRLAFGDGVYSAPRVVVRGTPLSQAEWTRLLDPSSPEPLPERARRLQAQAIELPELVSEIATPQGRQRTTYRNLRFETVAAGRIAAATADDGTMASESGRPGSGRFGRVAVQDLDLARSVALFYDKAGPGGPLGRVYGGFSIDDLAFDNGQGTTTRIGRMSGRDLAARPTSAGWLGTVNQLAATPDFKAATPEQRARSVDALAELFDAVSLGSLEMTDITVTSGDEAAVSGRVGRVAFAGAAGNRPAEIRVDGFDGGSPRQGKVRLAVLTLGGLSVGPLLEMMRDDPAAGPPQGPEAIRRLFGTVGSLRLSGLDVDLPDGRPASPADGPGVRSTRFGLGEFELLTGNPVAGLPSDFRLSARNVTVPVPPNPTDGALREVATLGYDRLDVSAAANLGWNEPGQELVVREISVRSAGMGNTVLRGVIGNVTRDAFNPDTAVASVALLGAAAKSAELIVENHGLFERVIARESKRQKRPPEDVRREYGMAAAIGIPAVLGNSPAAKALSQAVARFVAKPGRLVIGVRAKQPSGYGAADFAAGPDPASVLNALEITATAE